MRQKKIRNGGFVLIEFAIALPLLILVMYGLATVSLQLFKLGRDQLADYVLESEARYVMERITQEARTAVEIKITEFTDEVDKIKIVYHTVTDTNTSQEYYDEDKIYYLFKNVDVWSTRFFIPRLENQVYVSLNAKRQDDTNLTNPITGDNFFGGTKINTLKYDFDEEKKILHIELEMESLVTGRKIKIATAVFVSGYEVTPDE